ncbi:hypothetical protein [Lactobacillus sp. ESL0681]|uniref:hypothetical protein n=1 Tax=Lactobacillus sp. ESL0681 TaxID=2983211 RepID=UPI0023FA39EC|nr:hypothetical protein [Lactobacillus sp. ESL0681]WEV40247.1 hypothetical protein OZX59_08735 [Lactobacillus sp. ESL0681]
MFEHRLTNKQRLQVFGILQILIGIISYFLVNKQIRFLFPIIYFIFGLLLFLSSFIKRDHKVQALPAKNWNYLLGLLLICIGVLNLLIPKQKGVGLSLLDLGIMFLLSPNTDNYKK